MSFNKKKALTPYFRTFQNYKIPFKIKIIGVNFLEDNSSVPLLNPLFRWGFLEPRIINVKWIPGNSLQENKGHYILEASSTIAAEITKTNRFDVKYIANNVFFQKKRTFLMKTRPFIFSVLQNQNKSLLEKIKKIKLKTKGIKRGVIAKKRKFRFFQRFIKKKKKRKLLKKLLKKLKFNRLCGRELDTFPTLAENIRKTRNHCLASRKAGKGIELGLAKAAVRKATYPILDRKKKAKHLFFCFSTNQFILLTFHKIKNYKLVRELSKMESNYQIKAYWLSFLFKITSNLKNKTRIKKKAKIRVKKQKKYKIKPLFFSNFFFDQKLYLFRLFLNFT